MRSFAPGRSDQVVEYGAGRACASADLERTDGAEACGQQFLEQRHDRAVARPVGELDLVHVDVAPAALLVVDDFEVGGLAFELAHVPGGRLEPLVVLAGGGADDLAVDHQPDLGSWHAGRRRRGTG